MTFYTSENIFKTTQTFVKMDRCLDHLNLLKLLDKYDRSWMEDALCLEHLYLTKNKILSCCFLLGIKLDSLTQKIIAIDKNIEEIKHRISKSSISQEDIKRYAAMSYLESTMKSIAEEEDPLKDLPEGLRKLEKEKMSKRLKDRLIQYQRYAKRHNIEHSPEDLVLMCNLHRHINLNKHFPVSESKWMDIKKYLSLVTLKDTLEGYFNIDSNKPVTIP